VLLPREHGAYGQFLFPLQSALLIGRPALGAYLLGAAAVAAFLAHESLLVVLGPRGARALHEQGGDARRSLALLVGAAVVKHRERSTIGEILAAVALASVSLPVALAGHATRTDALTLFAVFAAVFVTATIAVRAVIGRVTKAGGPPPLVAGGLALLVVVGLWAVVLLVAAAVPTVIAAMIFRLI